MSTRIRIRMYHIGFGDCFLITFPHDKSKMLIDCGVHLSDKSGQVSPIVKDIIKETDGHVNVVVASHYHYDHICGFGKQATAFDGLQVDEVWMPWTMNPSDPSARVLFRLEKQLFRLLSAMKREEALEFQELALSNQDSLDVLKGFRTPNDNQAVHRYLPGDEDSVETRLMNLSILSINEAGVPL